VLLITCLVVLRLHNTIFSIWGYSVVYLSTCILRCQGDSDLFWLCASWYSFIQLLFNQVCTSSWWLLLIFLFFAKVATQYFLANFRLYFYYHPSTRRRVALFAIIGIMGKRGNCGVCGYKCRGGATLTNNIRQKCDALYIRTKNSIGDIICSVCQQQYYTEEYHFLYLQPFLYLRPYLRWWLIPPVEFVLCQLLHCVHVILVVYSAAVTVMFTLEEAGTTPTRRGPGMHWRDAATDAISRVERTELLTRRAPSAAPLSIFLISLYCDKSATLERLSAILQAFASGASPPTRTSQGLVKCFVFALEK